MEIKPITSTALFLLLTAFVFSIVGVASTDRGWFQVTERNSKTGSIPMQLGTLAACAEYMGARMCISGDLSQVVKGSSENAAKLQAVFTAGKHTNIIKKIVMGTAILAGFLLLLAWVVFLGVTVQKLHDDQDKVSVDYAFVLVLLASLVSVAGGVLIHFGVKKEFVGTSDGSLVYHAVDQMESASD